MHHALMLVDILGIGGDIDNNGVMLRQASFEIGLLPLVLFLLGCKRWEAVSGGSTLLLMCSSRKAEELEMQVLDEVKVTV